MEIKKKVEGVGYKFRLTATPIAITNYIEHFLDHSNVLDAQVSAELQSLTKRYVKLSPKMYIYYDRSSYRGRDDRKLRLTIDQNLIYRDVEVPLLHQKYGYPPPAPSSHDYGNQDSGYYAPLVAGFAG